VLPIGAPLVWIPAGLWLLAGEHTARGVFLLAYGGVVVSGADHLIRPYFIARGARIPFVLTVLGVLGGVFAFGALGIFLGPVLLGVGWMLILEFARGDVPLGAPGAPSLPPSPLLP
jgi:predicted PurR-regulated permease PerM